MEHDCRTINKGGKCKFLHEWKARKGPDTSDIFTCRALNVPLFPEFSEYGRINQELVAIEPIFECPFMKDMRKRGEMPHFIFSIIKDGSERQNRI